ncbi:hypothetical protein HUJ05_005269 [Dendroctonus ponderosae]|nr:hypothetical protein HUJ05_005269 [Dendroctonus ponderosae]
MLYGCETWQLTTHLERRLRSLEMDFWRRAAGKSRLERITNEEIRVIMNVKTDMIEKIQRGKLIWYRHIQRMDDTIIPKQTLRWTPTERKKRDPSRHRWMEYKNPCWNETYNQGNEKT